MATELQTALAQAVERNWPQQLGWFKKLVAFPSVRGEEGPCQDWIAQEFRQRGWAVDRYTLADVAMAHLPGYSPVMDTDYARAVQVVASSAGACSRGDAASFCKAMSMSCRRDRGDVVVAAVRADCYR